MSFHQGGYFRKSLMMQLTVFVMVLTAVVLSCSGIYSYKKDASALEATLRNELKQVSHFVATSLAEPVFNFADSTIISICLAAMETKEVVGLSVDQGDGMWLHFARNEQGVAVRVDSLSEVANSLKSVEPIVFGDRQIGELHVVITRKYMKESLWSAMKVSITTAIVLEVVLVSLLLLLLRFRFVLPLQHLAMISSKISQGDFEQPIDIHGSDELSSLTGSLSVMRDSIKQQFETLHHEVAVRQEAEERIKILFDSIPSVLVGVDKDGMVTQWNLEAKRTTGLSSEEALGQPLEKVFPLLTTEMERVSRAIATREKQTDLKRSRRANNETIYEDVTVYPLTADGVDGAVIRVDNVTEKVRLEEMMVQSEKMLSVGGLAAGMAHEINNPLAGIMQTASVMSNRLTNLEIKANRRAAEEVGVNMNDIKVFMEKRGILRMIATINDSGQRVAEIVNNMLSFARKSGAAVSSHDMAELMDKTLELAATDYDLKKQYDFKTIEIVKVYEENLPKVPCEGAKIQQVFLNILRNGAQAMQQAKANENVNNRFILRLAKEIKPEVLRIEIEDNGPGMDEATRRRVFEPFFTTKPVGEGTGLGLSVSYFIICENHGGEMVVESRPGFGAKFIIRLPVKRSKV